MQSKLPASGCNMFLVGAHPAEVTVNNGSTVTHLTPLSGLARGVVTMPLNTRNQGLFSVNPARQAITIVPKILTMVACNSMQLYERGAKNVQDLSDHTSITSCRVLVLTTVLV